MRISQHQIRIAHHKIHVIEDRVGNVRVPSIVGC